MNWEQTDKYLYKCKELYLVSKFPALCIKNNSSELRDLQQIAKEIIKIHGIDVFVSLLLEDHYLVQLWTAHIILCEEGSSKDLIEKCMKIIKKYADNTILPEVALSEQE